MINRNLQLIKQCLERKGYEITLLKSSDNNSEHNELIFNRQDNYIGCMHCWSPESDLHLRAYSLGCIFECGYLPKTVPYRTGYMYFIKNAFTMDKFLEALDHLDKCCIEARRDSWQMDYSETINKENYMYLCHPIPYYHPLIIDEYAKQNNYTIII